LEKLFLQPRYVGLDICACDDHLLHMSRCSSLEDL